MADTSPYNPIDLEIYKLLCDRVSREVDEVYTINKIFLVAAGAVLAIIGTESGNWQVHVVGGLIGLVIAVYWGASLRSQLNWRRWWMEEAARQEKRLPVVTVWQRVVDSLSTDDHPKPKVVSVTDPLHSLWRALLAISLLSFGYGLWLSTCGHVT